MTAGKYHQEPMKLPWLKMIHKQGAKDVARVYFIVLLGIFCLISNHGRSGEFLIIDREITWSVNAMSAFYMFMPDATMPANWLSPEDYYHGMIYTRYEIISVATNTPCGMQFGIFQWHPDATRQDSCGELCENIRWLNNGAGSVAENGSSPSDWWKSYGGVDFSRMGDIQSLCPTIWSNDPVWPVSKPGQGGDDAGIAWQRRFNWFPITVRVTVVAVSAGSTFSGWSNYIENYGDTPSPTRPDPVMVYPNPGRNGTFNIETGFEADYTVEVLTLEGKLLEEHNLYGGGNQSVDLKHLQKGLYLLKITQGNSVFTRKVILNK